MPGTPTPLLKRSVKELFGQDCKVTRPGRSGDYSFNNLGVSGAMLTSSMVPKETRDANGWYTVGGCGGNPAWHSEYDTIEVADRTVLENDVRLHGLVVARLANKSRVPLDYCEALKDLRNHVSDLAADRLGIDVASAIDAELKSALQRLRKSGVASSMTDTAWNTMNRRLSRTLVRLNYAIGPSSSRHDGLLHRASHRTGHADHASGSLDWSIKMPAQAGQIPAGC